HDHFPSGRSSERCGCRARYRCFRRPKGKDLQREPLNIGRIAKDLCSFVYSVTGVHFWAYPTATEWLIRNSPKLSSRTGTARIRGSAPSWSPACSGSTTKPWFASLRCACDRSKKRKKLLRRP